MSGEVVVVSAGTASAIFAVGGLMAAGSIAYQIAKAHQQQRYLEAQAQAVKKKRQLAAWKDYQSFQQQTMQNLNAERQMARNAFSNLKLNLDSEIHQQTTNNAPQLGAQAQGFLDADETLQIEQKLESLQNWLQELSPQLTKHPLSPVLQLKKRLAQLKTQTPRLETVDSFVETAQRSMTQLMQNLENQQQQQAQVLQQAEKLLDELLSYQQLAEAGTEAEEVGALHAHLLAILEQKAATVSLNALSVLEKKASSLKQQIDKRLEQQATETTVHQRIHHHLENMGYTAISQKDERTQSWTIPGGEQVRFSMQPDFKLCFQVAHERSQHSDTALSLQERAFLHQQEGKWCKDLPKLLKRLQEDGLNYQVDFERQLPDDGIPIVILETVDDLLAQEEEARHLQHDSVKRYLDR